MRIRALISGTYLGEDIDIKTITTDAGIDYGDAFDDIASEIKDAIDEDAEMTASLGGAEMDFLVLAEAEYVTYHTIDGEQHDIEYAVHPITSLNELFERLTPGASLFNEPFEDTPPTSFNPEDYPWFDGVSEVETKERD